MLIQPFLFVCLSCVQPYAHSASQLVAVNDLSHVFAIGALPQKSELPEEAHANVDTGAYIPNETSAEASVETLFSPERPELHPVWKGRKTLPIGQMRALCAAIAEYLGFPKETTCQFLLEIAAAESDFGYYVRQVRGPAQSVWQIEPATARDMHERLPRRNPELYRKIVGLRDPRYSEEENIVTNLNYGCAMCLGILYLKGIRFASLTTLQRRAHAWKKYYNTYLGKGTLEGYCQKAMRHLGASLANDEESFDMALLSGEDLFRERDEARFRVLPENFDTSPMGLYYADLLQKNPRVFEEVPEILLTSTTIHEIAQNVVWELTRRVQADPASIGRYANLPMALFRPLVTSAMEADAIKAYPNLPHSLQHDPELRKIYEAHRFVQEHLPRQ